MKKFLSRLQKNMMAVAFAEAGEWDTAKEMIPVTELSREPTKLNSIFMAITFAESGLPHDAVSFLELYDHKNRGFNASIAEELGLHGVRVLYGTVSL